MASMTKDMLTGLLEMPQMVVQTGVDMVSGNERDADGPVSVVGIGRISGDIAASGEMDTRAKAATLIELLASVNLLLFVFNMVPLLPLDGGHIAGALYEGIRRQLARIRGRKVLPGPADTAKLLPVAYVVSMFLVVMSVVIILADIFNPLSFG
jgi:membrane-associated protease RseP (regulator of RpoE activity)